MFAFKLAAVTTGAVLTLVFSVVLLGSTQGQGTHRGPVCLTAGPVPGLSADQAHNARTIAASAEARGGSRAAVIALAAALAESGLLVLTNPHDPTATGVAHQGVGYDHDSLGLFQQRPSWGTAAQRMDPVESSHLFLDALLRRDGWDRVAPWVAAQDVQRSAFDGQPRASNNGSTVYGGNYLARMRRAVEIFEVIHTDSGGHSCAGTEQTAVALPGPGVAGRLPGSYALPANTSPAASVAVTFALAQLGKPYLWGGTGPNGFDCSGLTQRAWAIAGHALGRTTSDQVRDGGPTVMSKLKAGDLVLVPGSAGSPASPSHMGMYIGAGLVVHAPKAGDVVKVTALSAFTAGGISALRHIA